MPDLAAEIDEMRETTRALYRQGSTDGLPVVPPTEERVQEMMKGTDLDGDEELGRLGNRKGILTVQKLAINGVMAGCRPVHMPVLVAGANALADPDANAIQVTTSTGSWAYLWLVNGPIRGALDIRSSFTPGIRSNRVVGRALGFAYKNTALAHPGEKDMGVQGDPFKFGLLAGENEKASPWEPMHETHGFEPEESTITIGGPNSIAQYTARHGDGAMGILKSMIYNTPPWMERIYRGPSSVWAVHCLTPGDAATLHAAGFEKRDVKEYLIENSDLLAYEAYSGVDGPDDDDPVPPLRPRHDPDPDQLRVVVLGEGADENVVIGPSLPGTVTKPIDLPANWEHLRAEYEADAGADRQSPTTSGSMASSATEGELTGSQVAHRWRDSLDRFDTYV